MSDIVLTTLNAKYIHAAFGLRYLLANMGELAPATTLLEFDINQHPLDIAERLVQEKPRIIGLGVYIWNTHQSLQLARLLKRLLPETVLVLGGPEVSFEYADQEIVEVADYTITGEADRTFPELCAAIVHGAAPSTKVIQSPIPDLATIALPYHLYTDEDLQRRILYVEASRGCPFTCEFCLSSLEVPVRTFDTKRFLAELDLLFQRGARQFKFVDRTFNLNVRTALTILDFFWERYQPGLFVHFEMVPDRLPTALRDGIRRFPKGALQFEVGIQTFTPDVAARISRKQNYDALAENLRFLREETGVHVHADLIAGLPGETLESFAQGFNRLLQLRPQEIQVGILKRLRGTPIIRHDAEWEMVYSADAPYEILSTKSMRFDELQAMRRFAKYWDLVANSGNFVLTAERLWANTASPFHAFMDFSQWLFREVGRRHSIALQALTLKIWEYLTTIRGQEKRDVATSVLKDFDSCGRRDYLPAAIREHAPLAQIPRTESKHARTGLVRQERHRRDGAAPNP